jgi:hypothetical protein
LILARIGSQIPKHVDPQIFDLPLLAAKMLGGGFDGGGLAGEFKVTLTRRTNLSGGSPAHAMLGRSKGFGKMLGENFNRGTEESELIEPPILPEVPFYKK